MPPTVAGVGAVAAATTAISPALPAITFQAGDVNLIVAESVGGENYTLPSGWLHLDTVSPVVATTNTQLTVLWRRWQAGDAAVSIGDSGDHNLGIMLTIRGCPATGNPWNVVGFAIENTTADNSALFPTATTTIPDCLVLLIGAWSDDFPIAALPVNANLTSIAEHVDLQTALGNDGGIYVASGVKATAGAIGTSTATLGGVAFKAMMTLAMAPSAALPVVAPPLLMAPRIAR